MYRVSQKTVDLFGNFCATPVFAKKDFFNKTCHRDRIAHLTASCPSHKKLQRKNFNILLMPTPPPTPRPTPGVVQ